MTGVPVTAAAAPAAPRAAAPPRWAALDALAGQRVRMQQGSEARHGVALGIDASGALRVRHDDGERAWHGGEVSARPDASTDGETGA